MIRSIAVLVLAVVVTLQGCTIDDLNRTDRVHTDSIHELTRALCRFNPQVCVDRPEAAPRRQTS